MRAENEIDIDSSENNAEVIEETNNDLENNSLIIENKLEDEVNELNYLQA